MVIYMHKKRIHPLVIKHSSEKNPISVDFAGKIIYKWSIFHCTVLLLEGKTNLATGARNVTKKRLELKVSEA
jgi:hypothetical protein